MNPAVNKISAINKKMSSTKKETAEPNTVDCGICCEPYNRSNHACIECEYVGCKYQVCNSCIRAYLLTSTNEPHCMECKQAWTPKFMLSLTKKWMTETYKPHREKFLCDVELSKLAETMPAAENYKLAQREHDVRAALRKREAEMRHELRVLSDQIGDSFQRENNYRRNIAPGTAAAGPAIEKKVFFMSCPLATCNGMLSTQYKCGICENYTCHDCHEVIGLNKTAPEHTCDPNNIASAQAIKKETKQCPGCHNRIYRTEGCSQMWCTGCHTAFDWNTGRKVVSEQLHNPHWLEYQRSQNNGQAPQAPGDVPCGGICTRQEMNRITVRLPIQSQTPTPGVTNLADKLRLVYGFVVEATTNQVRSLRQRCQELRDFQDERVKYIVGETTKEQLGAHIFKSDRLRQKQTEVLHIYELLSAVGVDMFNRLRVEPITKEKLTELVTEQLTEYDRLRLHCNGLFAVISNTYNNSVPQVNEYWQIVYGKFNSKTMMKVSSAADAVITANDVTEVSI